MRTQKYSVNQQMIETVLSWLRSEEIAIPEIQRPFLWDTSKVRDLIDSLYQGYPVGYLIAWRNPDVRLKNGTLSGGKKILIDGQQRVMSLAAAVLGEEVINKDYKSIRIKISFNPSIEKFEVFNPAIAKDKAWISDISTVVSGDAKITKLLKDYLNKNPSADADKVEERVENLRQIPKKQIGLIELDHDLDIETVADIFVRINSKGVPLSQADFAMSKIASNEKYGGPDIRKTIDYFCHLAVAPEFFNTIKVNDPTFAQTDYFKKMSWLKSEKDDLYDPDYGDVLRVSFLSEFNRGKMADLVSLLSGRNFEAKTYEEDIARESFAKLNKGILNFINENNFKKFIMIIRSACFIIPDLIRSQNVLNFTYVLYLHLRAYNYSTADIERCVRKWFVLCILTGRYSGSPESMFDLDIRNISNGSFIEYLNQVEEAELSDAFWRAGIVQRLDTSVASSPYFNVFLASQVKDGDIGFLSKDIAVADLIIYRGDIHHVFPREYLKKQGIKKNMYNQIANYVYTQSETNIKIRDKCPREYFQEIISQCKNKKPKYGSICDWKVLIENLQMNCIPESVMDMEINDYENFLKERRKLISEKIRKYYISL